ncbi:Imm63 family immunity protein [Lactococcus paracarnosus]|uniref:Immunity protein 63 domain-containing protein n=1 Tax=Pseudolactococcus paracarnosus TaxID=2749962 RepID=A0ABT0ALE6_9LACT|nr:Imm63 family immunity protein [Lactococcus paracarnosus]MCJ1977381.1 hypothetical protein [Lactococcus paracarnosus]MCJ1983491.1 hypothetical protein [Lactococcus paracarnosus]MCJ1998155.1 hypothetical protein [Lactococcus paracarnosus]
MNQFLSTLELNDYIKEHYIRIIEKEINQEVKLSNLFFTVGTRNSVEGTYIYSDNSGYNYLYIEKGEVKVHKITTNILHISYWVVEDIVFNYSIAYATNNKITGRDYRRQLFQKEKEIWKNLDSYGYQKKKEEIENILLKNPYVDKV